MLPRVSKNIAFYAAICVFLVVFAEASSYLVFQFLLSGRDFLHKDLDRIKGFITEDHLRDQKDLYDPDLGWVYPAGLGKEFEVGSSYTWGFQMDERGARNNPFPSEGGHISVYGDSYAFGADVNDDETWAYYLSELSGTRVDNWGTPAYGTDQAVLRVQKNFPDHPTDIVVLSVLVENINRIMSAYWPFYSFNLGLKIGFKPMLYETDRGLEWLPNPLRKLDSLADYHAAFERAKQIDYWYLLNRRRPKAEFPYTVSVINTLIFQVLAPPINLYEYPQARDRLDRVLTEFVELADEYRFLPVILFIPRMGARNDAFHSYIRRLRVDKTFESSLLIDVLESDFDHEKFTNKQTGMHLSPYGNQVLARVVYEHIAGGL